MRWIAWIVGFLLLATAVSALASYELTSRALAAMGKRAPALCLEQRQVARGSLPVREKDRIVAVSANHALGARTGIWWHVRGAAIGWTYALFWPEAERVAIFDRLAREMRSCSSASNRFTQGGRRPKQRWLGNRHV